ncbi:MAG TPA: UDP-2,3-diacylglucosamine diphosphatase [Gemmataceae bacterium]|nr:UDP-2,3-diacylglucosamine diphosphatase [Gemmataceae bacterium]
MYDAIVLSDLHLGAESCQVEPLLDLIDSLPSTAKLILNGDVLESTEYRLTKRHWRVLSQLRKLADQTELVWVRGNHDCDAESVAHVIGARFVPEYEFESGGRRVLCVHGDAWDRFLTDHPIITIIADWFYLRMQRWSRRLAKRAKRGSKACLRCIDRVRAEATEYGIAKGADVVICGHTHCAEAPSDSALTTCAYYNTGCWTDVDCHYLTARDGYLELLEVSADMIVGATLAV